MKQKKLRIKSIWRVSVKWLRRKWVYLSGGAELREVLAVKVVAVIPVSTRKSQKCTHYLRIGSFLYFVFFGTKLVFLHVKSNSESGRIQIKKSWPSFSTFQNAFSDPASWSKFNFDANWIWQPGTVRSGCSQPSKTHQQGNTVTNLTKLFGRSCLTLVVCGKLWSLDFFNLRSCIITTELLEIFENI